MARLMGQFDLKSVIMNYKAINSQLIFFLIIKLSIFLGPNFVSIRNIDFFMKPLPSTKINGLTTMPNRSNNILRKRKRLI